MSDARKKAIFIGLGLLATGAVLGLTLGIRAYLQAPSESKPRVAQKTVEAFEPELCAERGACSAGFGLAPSVAWRWCTQVPWDCRTYFRGLVVEANGKHVALYLRKYVPAWRANKLCLDALWEGEYWHVAIMQPDEEVAATCPLPRLSRSSRFVRPLWGTPTAEEMLEKALEELLNPTLHVQCPDFEGRPCLRSGAPPEGGSS